MYDGRYNCRVLRPPDAFSQEHAYVSLYDQCLVASEPNYRRLQAFTGVCDSVHRGGGCLPQCMLGCQTPQTRPPKEQTPPEQTPPSPNQAHPPEQTPPGPGTPLPRPGSPPRADTPREADARIRSIGGRYASYWNAFLLVSVSTERSSVAVP